jgi:hypothetical protein
MNRSTVLARKPTADHIPLGDEAVIPPPRDRLRGDVEPLGEILDREDLLARRNGDSAAHAAVGRPHVVAGDTAAGLSVSIQTHEMRIIGTHMHLQAS